MADESVTQIQQTIAQLGQEMISSGLIPPGKLISAMREHEPFAKKVVAILQKQRPADLRDLLYPTPKKTPIETLR